MWVAEHYQGPRASRRSTRPTRATPTATSPPMGEGRVHARAEGRRHRRRRGSIVPRQGAPRGSRPRSTQRRVRYPPCRRSRPSGSRDLLHRHCTRNSGFGGATGSGEVWAAVKTRRRWGSGGESQPERQGRRLHRAGPSGPRALAPQRRRRRPGGDGHRDFDPATFLAGALPKLFGLVHLRSSFSWSG